MGLLLICILLTTFFVSLFVWKWTLYIIVLLGNLTITAFIFKIYPLADGHGAIMVYIFFLLDVIILNLGVIPFFLFKKQKWYLYFLPSSFLFICEVLSFFGMSSGMNKNIQVSLLLFLSFFPLHILFYIKIEKNGDKAFKITIK